jgi:ABC-type polar amino acid transport system ATPase subunit
MVLRIRHLEKSFGHVDVLRNIDLDVTEGELVAIIGPSGAGKSTLLRCVNGLVAFESGEVEVFGETLLGTAHKARGSARDTARTLANIRSKVGMVFQTFNLFPHKRVLDNVTLAPMDVKGIDRESAERQALELLEKVGLADKAAAYPRQLSGGQQQRVAICRALAMQPELMLFDEVTSMLDPELVGEVLKVIKDLRAEGMTVLIVTHEMAFAHDVADRILVMVDGQIIEEGSPMQIFKSPAEDRTRVFLRRVLEKEKAT